MKATDVYRQLRARIGSRSGALEQLHCRHIACKAGCHDCCTNLTAFPVEFHAIVEDLQAAGSSAVTFDDKAACGYLDQGLCRIYQVRPLICRTHGLPIAFLNTAEEEPEMSVSFCPRNFIEADDLSFGPDSTLDLDDLNYQLYEANLQFIEEHPELGYRERDRVSLKDLASAIAKGRTGNQLR